VTTVSCPAAGDCDVGGYYTILNVNTFGFLSTEADGTWGKPITISADQVNDISCFSPASCAAPVTTPDGDGGILEKEPVQAAASIRSGLGDQA